MARFGFIYRDYVEGRGLFYNGEEKNLKYCYDPEVARIWYNENSKRFTEIKLDRPPNKKVKIQFPLYEAVEGDLDESLDKWLMENKISLRLEAVLMQFLQTHYFNGQGFVRKNNDKELAKEDKGVLMNMRDIILGMFRVTPVKIKSGFDKNTNKYKYTDWIYSQDAMNVSYSVAGKNYKTNLFGIYNPQLKRAMLGAKYNGSPLQNWQNDAWWNLGRLNFIVGSRELGKSFLMTAFTGCCLMKELSTQEDLERPFEIFYFGLSHDSNNTVAGYIMTMMLSLIDDKSVIKWYKTAHKLVLSDGEKERVIYFKSQGDQGVGRGSRPQLVIIDEASRMDEEVYKTNINTATTQVICISTVNYDTKKNWFWDLYQEARLKQRDYEPVDELIHRLWTKYGFNKIKDKQEIIDKFEFGEDKVIKDNSFGKIREEFFLSRPRVGLNYTIEDDQNKSREQKDMIIQNAMTIGEDYCLAELFGEVQDSHSLFNYEGLIDENVPDQFDLAVLGYDEAEKFDNAALVCVGILNNKAYVIRSEILGGDMTERYAEVRRTLKRLDGRSTKKPLFAVDVTRGEAYLREIGEKVEYIDYPIYYTKGADAKYKHPTWLVGKKHLVDITRNEFFNKFNIRLSSRLLNENGLVEELGNFKEQDNGRLEAKKGKDDQVNAMMVALFAAYKEFLRDEYVRGDRNGILGRDERIDRMLMEQEYEKDKKIKDKVMGAIYANFR